MLGHVSEIRAHAILPSVIFLYICKYLYHYMNVIIHHQNYIFFISIYLIQSLSSSLNVYDNAHQHPDCEKPGTLLQNRKPWWNPKLPMLLQCSYKKKSSCIFFKSIFTFCSFTLFFYISFLTNHFSRWTSPSLRNLVSDMYNNFIIIHILSIYRRVTMFRFLLNVSITSG